MIKLKLILISFFIYALFTNVAFAANVYVSPASIVNQSLTVGKNFTVDVKVDSVINLYGFDFKLYWNNSLLDLVSAKTKPVNLWFDSMKWIDNVSSFYETAYSAKSPYNAFTGSSSIATLTFNVKSIGSCYLEIKDAKLGDQSAFPITYSIANGYFDNKPKCTCGAWIKSGCEDDGTCTTCYYTRTCNPRNCQIESRRTKACQ